MFMNTDQRASRWSTKHHMHFSVLLIRTAFVLWVIEVVRLLGIIVGPNWQRVMVISFRVSLLFVNWAERPPSFHSRAFFALDSSGGSTLTTPYTLSLLTRGYDLSHFEITEHHGWHAFMLRVREVRGSILKQEPCILTVFRGVPQVLPVNRLLHGLSFCPVSNYK
jgi:hypothetical protein